MGVVSTQVAFWAGWEFSARRPDSLAVQADLFIIPVEGAMGKYAFASMLVWGKGVCRVAGVGGVKGTHKGCPYGGLSWTKFRG